MAQTPYPQTDREILRLIERSAGHRAGYKQLVRELGLGGGRERRLLLEQLARITARGELVKTADEHWAFCLRPIRRRLLGRLRSILIGVGLRLQARVRGSFGLRVTGWWRGGWICIGMDMGLCGRMQELRTRSDDLVYSAK